MNVETIIFKLLELRDHLQIYHWQTRNYEKHKASDFLYEKINTNIDRFVESYQRKNRINFSSKKNISIENINDSKIEKCIINVAELLENINFDKRSDLGAIRDDILEDINKAIFLFSLH